MRIRKDTTMYHKKIIRNRLWMCSVSVMLILLGIILICVRTTIYQSTFNIVQTLEPDSFSFNIWRENPIPLQLKLYLYNWTNPEQLLNRTVKATFKEMGPYIFNEAKEKANITWNSNDTVSYYYLKKWWFDQEKSGRSLSDPITSIAPVTVTAATAAKNWNPIAKRSISFFIGSIGAKLYDTHSVGEILFDGYNDPIINMASRLPSFALPEMPNYDKFGWFYTRNNSMTYEGMYNMGIGKSKKLGELYSWKNMEQVPYYTDDCGKVQGSGGDIFPTNLTKETIIQMFSSDLCRFIEFEFEKEEIVGGVLGYKYSIGDRVLDNGTKITQSKCFCNDHCVRSGVLDISPCRFGSPAYVSLPHFYRADPYYNTSIEGLKSDDELHSFFMTFEPTTGIPLKVAARLQINLRLQPVSSIRMYENVPDLFIPVLWFEQVVTMPGYMICILKIFLALENIILSLGLCIILLGFSLQVYNCYKIYTMKIFKQETDLIIREQVPLNLKNKDYEICR